MLHLIPAPLHRALLPWAHRIRQIWRKWAKPQLRGVSVIVTNERHEVLLLRHSYGSPLWALPGGGLSKTEDPVVGARRELREELAIDVDDLKLLGEMDETISGAPHRAFVFAAPCDAKPTPDKREVLEARFFAADALPDAISELTRRRLALLKSASQE